MKKKKWAIKSLIILVVFLLSLGIFKSYLDWHNKYANNIYPGITVGSLDLSGKTSAEASSLLSEETEKISSQGLSFQYGNKKLEIDSTVSSFDSDLSYPALVFDVENTINQALSFSQSKSYFKYLLFRLKPKDERNVKPLYSLNEEKIKSLLEEGFPELNIPPTNSSFSLSDSTGELEAGPEKTGKEINYDLALAEVKNNLDSLTIFPIELKTRSKYPEVKRVDLDTLKDRAKSIISQTGLKLTYNNPSTSPTTIKFWVIKPETLIGWISVSKEKESLTLTLDKEKIKEYISQKISPQIDTEATRSRFEIKNGKVVSWETGNNGLQVNLDASALKIVEDFLNGSKDIPLITKELVSDSLNPEATLNIKEIIGTGHSNFKGSSANRIKNIKAGAAAVSGMLIAPGEEFSLVKVLGEVTAENGYYPELVIKGDKTVKEYGGGLCQIGTTVFRSAIESGLPITYRRNHSYRVSYYEPAGMDAAVYIPEPDVRFINDTPNHILIQSRISGNDIYFDFWGTKDGRKVTITDPTIYNIVKPKPTKYIETTDLEPGKEKCTESAHNGADAYFDYKVVYPENSTTTPVHERRFSSHYVPWQKVCLIGKNAETPSASSTVMNIGAATTTEATTNPSSATSTETN